MDRSETRNENTQRDNDTAASIQKKFETARN